MRMRGAGKPQSTNKECISKPSSGREVRFRLYTAIPVANFFQIQCHKYQSSFRGPRGIVRQIKRLGFWQGSCPQLVMKWMQPIERLVELMLVLWVIDVVVSPFRPRTRMSLNK